MMAYTPGTNTGHGHVWERPDRLKARCGGPNLCLECAADMPPIDLTAARKNARTDADARSIAYAQDRIAELEAFVRLLADQIAVEHDGRDTPFVYEARELLRAAEGLPTEEKPVSVSRP